MEFDPGSCLPTYRLVSGIPGRSNALEIARHLGLREEILQRTTGYLSEEDRSTDLVLKRLARMERELAGREVQVTAHRNTLESMVAEYRQRLEDLRERQRYHKSHLQGEMAQLLAEYRKKLENSIREVRESQAEQEKIEQARSGLAELDQEFQQFVNEVVAPEEKMPEEISEGGGIAGVDVDGRTYAGGDRAAARSDRADIRGAGRGDCAITKGDLVEFDQAGVRTRGVVTGIEGKTAAIRAGSFRVKVGLDQVRFVGTPGERSGHTSSGPAAGSWEVSREIAGSASLDLRGQRYDDAVQELAGFMDRAVLDNRETVYIIHGMGTGALRQGVWDYLKTFPHADTWEYAHPDQGGYGCTIVTLK
jgi:DNA mismatch repair protein MutS2